MVLRTRCPGCKKSLSAKEALAGKTGKCPQCGSMVLFPAPEESMAGSNPALVLPASPWSKTPLPPGRSSPPTVEESMSDFVGETHVHPTPAADRVEGLVSDDTAVHWVSLACLVLALASFLLPWYGRLGFMAAPVASIGSLVILALAALPACKRQPWALLGTTTLTLMVWVALLPGVWTSRSVPGVPSAAPAVLGSNPNPGPPQTSKPASKDVVLVVENSEAMAEIPGLSAAVANLARGVQARDPEARFGLVTYQARLESKEVKPPTPPQPVGPGPFTRDADLLGQDVGKIRASGGGDEPESSLDAIHLACKQPWRADADRVLILITDASPKRPDKNIPSVAAAAEEMRQAKVQQMHLMMQERHRPIYEPLQKDAPGGFFKLQTKEDAFAKLLPEVGRHIAALTMKSRGLTTGARLQSGVPVDVLFLVDVTGSMQAQINGVKLGVTSFARELLSRKLDARIGFLAFRDQFVDREVFVVPSFPVDGPRGWLENKTILKVVVHPLDGGGFTRQPDVFEKELAKARPTGKCADEQNALDALAQAARQPFRAEADRVVVLVAQSPALSPDREMIAPVDAAEVLASQKVRFVHLALGSRAEHAFKPMLAVGAAKVTPLGTPLSLDWIWSAPPPVRPQPLEPISPAPTPEAAPALVSPGLGFWLALLGFTGGLVCLIPRTFRRPLDGSNWPRLVDLPPWIQRYGCSLASLSFALILGWLWALLS